MIPNPSLIYLHFITCVKCPFDVQFAVAVSLIQPSAIITLFLRKRGCFNSSGASKLGVKSDSVIMPLWKLPTSHTQKVDDLQLLNLREFGYKLLQRQIPSHVTGYPVVWLNGQNSTQKSTKIPGEKILKFLRTALRRRKRASKRPFGA